MLTIDSGSFKWWTASLKWEAKLLGGGKSWRIASSKNKALVELLQIVAKNENENERKTKLVKKEIILSRWWAATSWGENLALSKKSLFEENPGKVPSFRMASARKVILSKVTNPLQKGISFAPLLEEISWGGQELGKSDGCWVDWRTESEERVDNEIGSLGMEIVEEAERFKDESGNCEFEKEGGGREEWGPGK